MSNFKDLKKGVEALEASNKTIQGSLEAGRRDMHQLWQTRSSEAFEHESKAMRQAIRESASGDFEAIKVVGPEIEADLVENFSSEAVRARSVLTPGAPLADNLMAETAFGARLQRADDVELGQWARTAVETANHRMERLVRDELHRRGDKDLSARLGAKLEAMPDPAEAIEAAALLERLARVQDEARWADDKIAGLEGKPDAKPVVSEDERLKTKARQVRESLKAASGRIAQAITR